MDNVRTKGGAGGDTGNAWTMFLRVEKFCRVKGVSSYGPGGRVSSGEKPVSTGS